MRLSLVISCPPGASGTLKSTRINTVLFLRARSRTDNFAIGSSPSYAHASRSTICFDKPNYIRVDWLLLQNQVAQLMTLYPRIYFACHLRHVQDERTKQILSAHQASILDHLDEFEPLTLRR